ncbi:MAG TPA: hypothetical protein VGB73_00570 [Pyrinomonadaceae bacterium]|jgi:tetratricopeptide (TPR) repeat protein
MNRKRFARLNTNESGGAPVEPKAESRLQRGDALLVSVIIVGLALSAALARFIEARRPPESALRDYSEELYVTPEAARRMSLGFNGLVADWYWMRSLQYVGRKLIQHPERVQIDDLSAVGLKILPSLMDTATTLDPQFMAAYEYGAVMLPAIDAEAAIRLARKGIEANPHQWRLYQQLGYIHWQRGEFKEASAVYHAGAKVLGAPRWMEAMAARMEDEGGNREVAREIFRRMYDEADDEEIKKLALQRLAQLQSFDEREAIRRVFEDYRRRTGRCPDKWAEVAPLIRRSTRLQFDEHAAPLDPANTAYILKPDCEVDLDPRSEVPYK